MNDRGSRRRGVEMALLFGVLPVGVALARREGEVLVIPILVAFSVAVFGALVIDRSFDVRAAAFRAAPRGALLAVVARALALGAAVLAAAWACPAVPTFGPALEDPSGFVLLVLVYPFVSVVPQELVFRVFLHHRYGVLLGRATLAVSAAAFALAHLVFWSGIALALTFLGGLLFGHTYGRTGSFWAVCLEHALIGTAVLASGFGQEFLDGTAGWLGLGR